MTAWPPEIPDPFDPKRMAYGRKLEGTWGKITRETETFPEPAPEPAPALEEPSLPEPEETDDIEQSAEHFRSRFDLLKDEVQKLVVGQEEIIEHVITALVAGGHVLLEGVPGLGKATLVRSLASTLSLFFQRVQFTSDFETADLIGANHLISTGPGHTEPTFEFSPGPIFCNLLLGDHINRASPKTQSALLEAMEEKSVTVGGQARLLSEPFFVLATQNPQEEGVVNPLSPAQLDRFFFSLPLSLPTVDEMETILERTTEADEPELEPVFPGEDLVLMRDFARGVLVEPALRHQIAELVTATHPQSELASAAVKEYVFSGASPRAGQALVMAAKIRALREGRFYVTTEDVVSFAIGVLRHRIVLTPKAQEDGLSVEDVLTRMLQELYGRWGE
jgi:MoxR-like ATPase